MLKIINALAIALLAAGLATARPFTNTAGKTIEAEIESATATTVTLELPSGKKAKIPLNSLSEADQKFVKDWVANRTPRLRVTPNLVRSNKDADYYDDGRQLQSLKMSIEVENDDYITPLGDSELKYILVGRSLRNTKEYKILAVQTAPFKLGLKQKTTLKFKTVKNTYDDGRYYKTGHKCVGYVLYATRKSDGRKLYSFGSTKILKESIFNIVNLESGDLTGDSFMKRERGIRGGGDDDVIEVE